MLIASCLARLIRSVSLLAFFNASITRSTAQVKFTAVGRAVRIWLAMAMIF